MGQISVAQAAEQLGVGVSRVHQRITDGSLPAVRIGSRWVIDEASLTPLQESRHAGRPLSHRSAWALVALSQAGTSAPHTLAPTERSRARKRLDHLLAQTAPASEQQVRAIATLVRSWMRNRAERRLYHASPRDLSDLRADERLTLAGVSHRDSGITAADLVEGYVVAQDLAALTEDYLLSPITKDREANVVLHVTATAVLTTAPLVLAADLAEHRRPREDARAAEILRELAA